MQQKQKKQSDVAVLLSYAGSYKGLTYLGLCLSAGAMVLGITLRIAHDGGADNGSFCCHLGAGFSRRLML